MSYTAAVDQLNTMVAELYTRPGQPRRKFSLDEIRILLSALGDPQLRFPSVLIGGTNGKGSTAATLASILITSGLRTGLYTSPHLVRANERIRLDGAEIADQAFADVYFRVHDAAQQLVHDGRLAQMPSFFEVLTAMAFLHFAQERVEIGVIEVGMGGRLDATNILDPLISIITDISLDHTEWLGSTIAAITREKAGILRRNGTLITLPQDSAANQVLGEVAVSLDVRAIDATAYLPPASANTASTYSAEVLGASIVVDSPLTGPHQRRNIALAIASAVELAGKHGFPVTAESIAAGIKQTRWPGRLERLNGRGVKWILDVAHNGAGALALRAGLGSVFGEKRPRTLVFSCLRDKPLAEMAQTLFPLFDQVIVAPIHTARATSLANLMAAARLAGASATAADTVSDALRLAEERTQGGVIVVSGSVYLVGEARPLLMAERGVKL
jgi:dihydrofolate synthase/folylpolyglutamate synthase